MNVSDLIRELNKLKKKEPNAEVIFFGKDTLLPSNGRIALAYTDSLTTLLDMDEDKVVKNPTEEFKTPFILLDSNGN